MSFLPCHGNRLVLIGPPNRKTSPWSHSPFNSTLVAGFFVDISSTPCSFFVVLLVSMWCHSAHVGACPALGTKLYFYANYAGKKMVWYWHAHLVTWLKIKNSGLSGLYGTRLLEEGRYLHFSCTRKRSQHFCVLDHLINTVAIRFKLQVWV